MTRRRQSINPPLSIYKKIALSFIVLTLILIGVIFYFTLSYAYIDIFPNEEEVVTDFNFIIVEDSRVEDMKDGVFVGKIIDQEIEGEKTFDVTGTKQVVGDIVGKVNITNDLTREQILITTTRLLTAEGVLFRLKDRVTIPGGGSIETDVYPDDPTKELATTGTKFTIPGLSQSLQELIYAEAINDFKADGDFVSAISQEEVDKAIENYSEELGMQIFSEDDIDKTKILSKQIIEQELSNEIGDEISQYTLKLKIKVVGVMFDDKLVKFFAKETLESLVPLDKELVVTNADNLVYEIEKYDLDNNLAQIKGNIRGLQIISEESPILDRDKLTKLNLYEIKAYLENYEDVKAVEINFKPSWAKKIPYFQDHIIIRIIK